MSNTLHPPCNAHSILCNSRSLLGIQASCLTLSTLLPQHSERLKLGLLDSVPPCPVACVLLYPAVPQAHLKVKEYKQYQIPSLNPTLTCVPLLLFAAGPQ
jgi:hypothetical protein